MTAALIIASGKTASPGRFQPMAAVGNLSAVERIILVFQAAGIEKIAVVGGEDYAKLEKHIARLGVVCLFNQAYQSAQMLDSVKFGLEYLQGKCSRVLITPVDTPLFSVETVQQLVLCGAKAAVPSHGHKAGHPLLLSAKWFGGVLQYTGGGGLAGALKALQVPITYVNVPDEGVLVDVGRQKDVQDLVARHSLRRVRPGAKLSLAREQVFFGPGPYLLFSLIQETQSLRVACRQMGISYSKGWKIVQAAEQELGYKMVDRSRGGREKGSTVLTEKGAALLGAYARFAKDCRRQVEALFKQHFSEALLRPDGADEA